MIRHIFLLLILTPLVYGLGVQPATTNYFDVGMYERQLWITGDAGSSVEISLDGTLADYMTLEETLLVFSEQTRLPITFSLDIPSNQLPGTYTGRVIISQTTTQSDGTVSGLGALAHRVTVTVPSVESLLLADLFVSDVIQDEPSKITVSMQNVGTEVVEDGTAVLRIQLDGVEIYTDRKKFSELDSGQKQSIVFDWTPQAAGSYTIITDITYAGRQEQLVKDVLVEELIVDILSVRILEEETSPEILIEIDAINRWNRVLSGLYAQTEIVQDGVVVETIRTANTVLDPGQQKVLRHTWNPDVYAKGDYSLRTTLVYRDRTTQKITGYSVYAPRNFSLYWLIPILLAFAVFIGFVYFRKSKRVWK